MKSPGSSVKLSIQWSTKMSLIISSKNKQVLYLNVKSFCFQNRTLISLLYASIVMKWQKCHHEPRCLATIFFQIAGPQLFRTCYLILNPCVNITLYHSGKELPTPLQGFMFHFETSFTTSVPPDIPGKTQFYSSLETICYRLFHFGCRSLDLNDWSDRLLPVCRP